MTLNCLQKTTLWRQSWYTVHVVRFLLYWLSILNGESAIFYQRLSIEIQSKDQRYQALFYVDRFHLAGDYFR